MIAVLRESRFTKTFSWFLNLAFVAVSLFPRQLLALTSGPSHPDVQHYSAVGTDNMVDPFTGDFNYSIPLLDVGGYPLSLNYASGITMDQEASWVGLGWNLNVGSINRNLRGLPDDFSGDVVSKDFNMKPNTTFGASGSVDVEIAGFPLGVKPNLNVFYNTYHGFGFGTGVGLSLQASKEVCKTRFTGRMGLATSFSTEDGITLKPSLGLSATMKGTQNNFSLGSDISMPYNTLEGFKGVSLSNNFSYSHKLSMSDFAGSGLGQSGFIGFAQPTYLPYIENDMTNTSATIGLGLGASNAVSENALGGNVYVNTQRVASSNKSLPAYGYMYTGQSNEINKLLDFNREKDSGFNEFTNNLPITNYSYDLFQVSGYGTGGTFRLHRGDVGTVHDPKSVSKGTNSRGNLELEAGGPPSTKIGGDFYFSSSNLETGGHLRCDKGRVKHFKNENESINGSVGKEVVYFKKIGDFSPENDNAYTASKLGTNVVRHDMDLMVNGNYEYFPPQGASDLSKTPIPSTEQRSKRINRTSTLSHLTVDEAKTGQFMPIYNYVENNFTWYDSANSSQTSMLSKADTNVGFKKQKIRRDGFGRAGHHISEFKVTEANGARYIYGFPVYNMVHQDVNFSVAGNGGYDPITYGNGDNSIKNSKGMDNYYSNVQTPPYAYSYLLTSAVSPDYIDQDSVPGPSDGDYGNYTKFNYSQLAQNQRWRTPFAANTANYSRGLNTKGSDDDKGSYAYGEKEICYLHSIETRDHVAVFYTDDRDDGLGVADFNGGVDKSVGLKKLKKIVLYAKSDMRNTNPEPIKTVYFEYDYSLCPNTVNSVASGSQGKLTLKKVWFTYGKSSKGVVNPYIFNYAGEDKSASKVKDPNLNPSYKINGVDRWGNYKRSNNNSNVNNVIFPYTNPNKDSTDLYAGAWAMSSVMTPTGGILKVFYESDDYGYVQNKQAMRMFRVLGMANASTDTSPTSTMYTGNAPNNYIMVDLEEGFTPKDPSKKNEEFRRKYLSGIDYMYHKFSIEVLNGYSTNVNLKEFVPGYAAIEPENSVLVGDGTNSNVYKKALIKLKMVNDGKETKDNPIIRNAFMFARLHLNRELTLQMLSLNITSFESGGLVDRCKKVVSILSPLVSLFNGFFPRMRDQGNCKTMEPNVSFVRLNEPDKIKMGGGHRVRAIILSDNWDKMIADNETPGQAKKEAGFYGQLYDYSMMENGEKISSGVAAYEPIIGNEENPFKVPLFGSVTVSCAPSKEFFTEEPLGESFYPSPVVGYRKVKTIPIKITNSQVNPKLLSESDGTGNGWLENEFYTAYDFPTIANRTVMKSTPDKSNPLVLAVLFYDRRVCTQGYYIEINDMHGKPKAQRIFADQAPGADPNSIKPVSEVITYYKTNANGSLSSSVPVVNSDLSISSGTHNKDIGLDIDMVHDERYSISSTVGAGLQGNFKYEQISIIPLFFFIVIPSFTSEEVEFQALVTTKVVNRLGIVDRVVHSDNGTTVTNQNLAWDAQTGQLLLSSVQNEFGDPVYSFSYPAYWAYDRMNAASTNDGYRFTNLSDANVLASLKEGDEVVIPEVGNAYFVKGANNSNLLVNKKGRSVSFNAANTYAKIARSGARNLMNLEVGNVKCLDNPMVDGDGKKLKFTRVLAATAQEFNEDWAKMCNCSTPTNSASTATTVNYFATGQKGNFRPYRTWTYLTGRTQSLLNNNLNIRNEGYFIDFIPFWSADTGRLQILNTPELSKWQYGVQSTNYNSLGMEIESRDVLNRYMMAQFGFARNLVVGMGSNSRYRESGFDGFEDYGYGNCADDHLSWRENYATNVINTQSHTGKYSIKVSPTDKKLRITKVMKQ